MNIRLVTDYLDNSAKNNPNKIAFSDEKRNITFKELYIESRKIAQTLINRNMFKVPVLIYLDKSVEVISSFMGVAYSGNFYTPIDVTMPITRIEKIIETLSPSLIITDYIHEKEVRNFSRQTEILIYEDMQNIEVDESLITKTVAKVIDTDILYVLFTSGSTGIPKGVIVSHKSVIAYTEWFKNTFLIDETTVLGNQTPFYFSMSVTDIFSTIAGCATMYIIPKQLFTFPIKLLEYISEHKINTIYWVPSALCLVANLKALGKRDISCLKKVLFAGESMPTKQLNMWRKQLPDVLYANLFGPTETTDICNYYIINRELLNTETIPIGESCNNCDLLILNEKNEAVKNGESGELCVRGSFLAYGYYNNPQKTSEVFVQNPLNPYYNELIYRTGDIVQYNDRGELIYLGRKDFQIKHMGHRIELGEIEVAVSSLEGILENCALYDTKHDKIVLFYSGHDTDNESILLAIKELVPHYMVPEKIISMKNLPHNLNGKIDRALLKKLLEE